MKLKVFNKENSQLLITGEPIVRISVKAGLFSFSKDAGILLGLDKGNKLEFLQDEHSKEDWYITISDSEKAFTCRTDGEKSPRYDFNSRGLTTAILDSIKFKGKGIGFKIQKNPIEFENKQYFLLITSNPLNPIQ